MAVTAPDSRRGRGSRLAPTAVKEVALSHGIEVIHDHRLLTETANPVECGLVVAYGQLFKRPFLERLPLVNLHFSLLPKWRGAAPVEHSILAGELLTGVSLMRIERELDAGPLLAQKEYEMGPDEPAGLVRSRLASIGAELIKSNYESGFPPARQQTGRPTYASKIAKSVHRIVWSHNAEEIHRVVRLGQAWSQFRGSRIKVLATEPVWGEIDSRFAPGALIDNTVVCGGRTQLRLLEVQPAGKRAMSFEAWANGAGISDSDCFD